MAKLRKVEREDWLKMASYVRTIYRLSIELQCMCERKCGKSSKLATDAKSVYNRMKIMKNHIDDDIYAYADYMFDDKEISHVAYGSVEIDEQKEILKQIAEKVASYDVE